MACCIHSMAQRVQGHAEGCCCSEPGAGRVGQAGKAAVHTAAGGIHPRHILPLALDVGCNTSAVREDPFYVGLKQVGLHISLCPFP